MTMPTVADRLRDARKVWRGITGADAYERYVAHLRRAHPGADVPSEREFWRQKYAAQDANPGARCC